MVCDASSINVCVFGLMLLVTTTHHCSPPIISHGQIKSGLKNVGLIFLAFSDNVTHNLPRFL